MLRAGEISQPMDDRARAFHKVRACDNAAKRKSNPNPRHSAISTDSVPRLPKTALQPHERQVAEQVETDAHNRTGPSRQAAAYSSLPPSPRRKAAASDQLEEQVGLGIKNGELPNIRITRICSDSLEASSQARDLEGYLSEPETEEWWPARSRRNTIDSSVSPLASGPSPRAVDDIAIFETPDAAQMRRSNSVDSVADADRTLEPRDDPKRPPDRSGELSGASLWALLKDEQGAEGWEGWIVDGKWDRIQNFLAVPLAVERVSASRTH